MQQKCYIDINNPLWINHGIFYLSLYVTNFNDLSQYMKERNIPENAQQTTTQAGDKRVLKRLLKAMLWIAGIWLALLIILQVALSPAVLTKVVDKLAPQYIDGDLSFSKIKISMFRYFPNVGITWKMVRSHIRPTAMTPWSLKERRADSFITDAEKQRIHWLPSGISLWV